MNQKFKALWKRESIRWLFAFTVFILCFAYLWRASFYPVPVASKDFINIILGIVMGSFMGPIVRTYFPGSTLQHKEDEPVPPVADASTDTALSNASTNPCPDADVNKTLDSVKPIETVKTTESTLPTTEPFNPANK